MFEHLLKGGVCVAVAAAGFIAEPAHAATDCWNPTQVAAAKIRDLQSRLMVATMRCRAMGIDVLPVYNDFVRTNRTTIQAANTVIKARFTTSFAVRGQFEYDHFTTMLANAYGADATSADICRETEARAREAIAADGDADRLLEIVGSMGPTPYLPGGLCKVDFAQAAQ
jgi:hypothetical protein